MIKINLLPFRAARKRENIRRQVSISGLLYLLFVVILGVWFFSLSSKLSGLEETENSKKTELDGYTKELEEIKTMDAMIKEINTKLDVIKELQKGKTGPVLLLSTISDAVPKDKLYLTMLKEQGGVLTLKGTAMDNETVALFMKNLEKAGDLISSVDLSSVKLREIKGEAEETSVKVADFSLECRTYAYKVKEETTDQKAKKSGKK